jgi:hypothetical protein
MAWWPVLVFILTGEPTFWEGWHCHSMLTISSEPFCIWLLSVASS